MHLLFKPTCEFVKQTFYDNTVLYFLKALGVNKLQGRSMRPDDIVLVYWACSTVWADKLIPYLILIEEPFTWFSQPIYLLPYEIIK